MQLQLRAIDFNPKAAAGLFEFSDSSVMKKRPG